MASDDQFNPPHVDDETPLDVARPLKAGIFARRFRQAAAQFRNSDLIPARSRLKSGRVDVQPLVCKLEEDCGRWIIQAHKCGLIPPAPKELVDFIEWHRGENPKKLPPGTQTMKVRCAYNLFLDVSGGGLLKGIFRGRDEGGRVILEGARRAGGLMPRLAEGHLELPECEQRAATCEYLADLIGQSAEGSPSKAATPLTEGPHGDRWLTWGGVRYDIPKGIVYRLIAHMWGRDSATCDSLFGDVFDDVVEPQTIRSKVNKANGDLRRIGVPWKLTTDSISRNLTKRRTEES